MYRAAFLIAMFLAAVVPLAAPSVPNEVANGERFPGWPQAIDGRPIRPLPLTEAERGFADAFPGKVARFTDGERHYILRWVLQPTRRLHPAAHCLRASGYTVGPEQLCEGNDALAACYLAERAGKARWVTERIHDDAGNGWSHVSEWYWAASLGQTEGPWWVVTTVRAAAPGDGA